MIDYYCRHINGTGNRKIEKIKTLGINNLAFKNSDFFNSTLDPATLENLTVSTVFRDFKSCRHINGTKIVPFQCRKNIERNKKICPNFQ